MLVDRNAVVIPNEYIGIITTAVIVNTFKKFFYLKKSKWAPFQGHTYQIFF